MAPPWYYSLTGLLRFAVLLLVFGAVINAGTIPSKQSPAISHPDKAVTWGTSKNDKDKSSVCTDTQIKVLIESMPEAAKLAKAGSDGLAIILDMLTEQKPKYNALPKKDRDRIRETYFTFFGRITKKEQFDIFKTRASFIKGILDRIAPLTQSTWPANIRFFCDSTYYQDQNNQGLTWDQVEPPMPPPPPTKEWKFDKDTGDKGTWAIVRKESNCKVFGSTIAAYTLSFNKLEKDRITFCPAWFDIIKSPEAGKSISNLDPAKDIQVGIKLKDFTRKAGRIFLHEHLHTWTFNQIKKKSEKLVDVEEGNPYGPDNAERLAKDVSTQDKANRNIENVVYWCIAMYYSTWDWSTLSAATPGKKFPASAPSPKAALESSRKTESEPKSQVVLKPTLKPAAKPAAKKPTEH
ncbi:hypothetical protein MMC13_002253 [Lambiella insularis]|nr:hypothetical protein [Lambiella insularis]